MQVAELALIVPVWKAHFLDRALTSIEKQSAENIRVYLFDDAATAEVSDICNNFIACNPNWHYYRFEENLGGKNLAAHWNRCIRRTGEKWIWLFSDDDEMEAGCTEAFFQTIAASPGHDVYRFPFGIMDEIGQAMPVKNHTDTVLSGAEFGRLRFLRELDSSAVEFIFSREAFEKNGGFPEFPAAWCADDAAWIMFSGKAGIRSIQEAGVRWRWSRQSISGAGGSWTDTKLEAAVRFIQWYNNRFPEAAVNQSFRAEQVIWLRLQMVHQHYQPGISEVLRLLMQLRLPGLMNQLRGFQDLYCLSYVYHQQVILHKSPSGWRYWLSRILPAF